MAIRIILPSRTFTSKASAKDFFRKILNRYAIGHDLNQEDFEVLSELLERHPDYEEKLRHGISSIRVLPDDQNRNRCFWIVGENDELTDFSYLICINGEHRPIMQQISSACRTAVSEENTEYRRQFFEERGGVATCSVSNQQIVFGNSVIDHQPPMVFNVIVRAFCAADFPEGFPEDLIESGTTSGTVTRFSDENISQRFRDFHNRLAVLRVIHRNANSRSAHLARIFDDANRV